MATACTAGTSRRPGTGAIPAKLLLDPYAKAIEGQVRFDQAVFGYEFGDSPERPSHADSAPFVPSSVVANPISTGVTTGRRERPITRA